MSDNHTVYEFDNFRLDAAKLMLYRGGQEIFLPPKVIETLLVLIENRGQIIGKDELMDKVWSDAIVEESNLSQYLYRLRKTLGNRADGKPFIETFRRRGYRFNGEVRLPETTNGSNSTAQISLDTPQYQVEQNGNALKLSEAENVLPKRSAVSLLTGKITLIAAIALFVFSISFLFVWYKFSQSSATAANPKNEMTILRLTNGGAPQDATISPDGNYFVYHEFDEKNYRLWLQQTGQSNRLEIIPPTEKRIFGKTFSPDGQFVYFVAQDKTEASASLYRVPTLSGTANKILDDINSSVSFSPDGKELVFQRWNEKTGESSLIIASADGGDERILLRQTKEQGFLGFPAWSPNAILITFPVLNSQSNGQGGYTINGINPQTGVITMLSPEKWDGIHRTFWTYDGAGLIFVGTKAGESYSTRRDQIYYLSYPSGEARRLTTDGNRYQLSSLGITAANEIIAVPYNRSSQIWRMSANGDSRTAGQITNGLADGRAGLVSITDGRIGYIGRIGDNLKIWVANGDGSNQKQLTDDPPFLEELRAPADGSFFIFSAPGEDNTNHLFRINADGADRQQLTFGKGSEIDSSVSPDGNWIVYDSAVSDGVSYKHSLWKISGRGSEPVQVYDNECATPHFSPNGKYISCVYREKEITIISAENGAVFKTFQAVKNSVLNSGARWSPDGQALIYPVNQGNYSNLWQQYVKDGTAKPLTDFTSGDIYNFSFSADDSQLYIARGYQIRDVLLIKNFR